MDIDQLQAVRDRERDSDDLQELRESFYAEAAGFIADLRQERAAVAEEADDPFDSPRVSRLTDRIRTAEQTLEAIYEKRVGKVIEAATFAAADLPAAADGMTAEEADLFETLVAEIEANRETVLGRLEDADDELAGSDAGEVEGEEVIDGTAEEGGERAPRTDSSAGGRGPRNGNGTAVADPEPPPEDGPSPESSSEPGPERSEPSRSDPEGADRAAIPDEPDQIGDGGESRAAEAPAVERELVRITDDVGAILGVDEREYDLAEDDVVTLPAANARPLIEQGAAERLE